LGLALILGIPGLLLGISLLIAHILSLRSFNMAQVRMNGTLRIQNLKDSIVRAPLDRMAIRPAMASGDRVRMQKPERRWWH